MTAALLLAAGAAFLAGVLGGFTGFGISVVLVPLLLLAYDPATVVVLNGAISAAIAAAVARDSWREADRPAALLLTIAALPGLAVGAEALRVVDPDYLKLAVGALLLVSAALLAGGRVRLPGAGTRSGAAVVGLASGALASSTGLSGPPAALLLKSRGLPKEAFRATIALFFLGMDAALLAVLVLWGVAKPGHALLALLLVPAAIAGKAVGTALFGKASQRIFRAAALGTVFLIAALGVVTALRALI